MGCLVEWLLAPRKLTVRKRLSMAKQILSIMPIPNVSWIPKEAGYLSKGSRSGLEDNGTYICLEREETLCFDVLKKHQMLAFKTLQDRSLKKSVCIGPQCLPASKEAIIFQFRG